MLHSLAGKYPLKECNKCDSDMKNQRKATSTAKLIVNKVYLSFVGKATRTVAEVECECGTIKVIRIDGLTSGNTRSCGCLVKEVNGARISARNKESAKFSSFSRRYPKTFATWRSMITRCYNTKQKAYATYGKVGVVVCEGLRESPQNLVDLIGLRMKKKPSLDRCPIHDGNYTCGKCGECEEQGWELNIRWTTRKEQSENRGKFNVHLSAFGKVLLLSQWEKLSGIDARRISTRIRRDGWSVERALTTPDSKGNCYHPE